MDNNRTGDLAEHYAITWLWDNGYEVFKNAGCTGPIDIVAVSPEGETVLIDVKTMIKDVRYPESFSANKSRTPLQKEMGVVILQFNPVTRDLKFTEHRDEKVNPRYRDKQHAQQDLDLCHSGC